MEEKILCFVKIEEKHFNKTLIKIKLKLFRTDPKH